MIVRLNFILIFLFLTECLIMAQGVMQDVTYDIEVIASRLKAGWGANRISEDRVQEYVNGLQTDGTWEDIDYTREDATHWPPSVHTARLAELAEVYSVTQDEVVKEAVLRGLRFWAEEDPQSTNWWWNCIWSPARLSKTLLLMGDGVPEDLVDAVALQVHRSTFKRTGANLTNEASNLLVLACATDNADLLQEAIHHLTGEIRVAVGEEGIQVDHSFHQHGPQLQMGSYASVFMRDATEHALLFDETAFALSDDKVAILADFVLEGQQWFVWGNRMDFHGMGRGAGRTGSSTDAGGMGQIAARMAKIDAAHKETYDHFVARTKGALPPGEHAPQGNRHFYRSDVMVHRPGDFYASVRMHSTRTYACEVRVNLENLKGYHLSDGAYFVMQRGDEYLDIQPVWDWRKLPGVTYLDTDASFPYGRDVKQHGNTDFVGGVTDGQVGLAAMDFAKDDVFARKAYFFFDGGFVCLGAGITTETQNRVITSVNQCLLHGDVMVLGDSPMVMGRGRLDGEEIRGVFHDGIGYYFIGDQNVVVRSDVQKGSWKDLEANAKTDDVLAKDVFSLWIEHGTEPADDVYAYAVMPGLERNAFVQKVAKLPFTILKQTTAVQAVAFPEQNVAQVAFFESGSVQVFDDLDVEVDTPCLMVLKMYSEDVILSVSDPTQKLAQVTMTLGGLFEGEGVERAGDSTVVTVDLPQDEWAGKTVTWVLKKSN